MVTPAGGKWWRLKYRFDGKEKLLSLGTYPDTSLAMAREKRDAARSLLAATIGELAEKIQSHHHGTVAGITVREKLGLVRRRRERNRWSARRDSPNRQT